MQYVRVDTATEVPIGPAVAVGNGFTPVTTLSIAGADEAHLIKHGATGAIALSGTLGALSGADGYYTLDLTAGEVNTEGRLRILINDDSLILPIKEDFMVMNQNAFDAFVAVAGTALLSCNVKEINDNVTAAIRLALSASAIAQGTCEGTPSTTVIQTDLAETDDDIYIGRILIFIGGPAQDEATEIEDYVGSSGTLTVAALAQTPLVNDPFIIV